MDGGLAGNGGFFGDRPGDCDALGSTLSRHVLYIRGSIAQATAANRPRLDRRTESKLRDCHMTCHHTEPVSSGAPKVPIGAQGATFYFRANAAATLHCTGQGYPVPTFR